MPARVLQELAHIATLLFGLAVGLRSEWAPFVLATDGAQDFGYGGASARCHPDITRLLAEASYIDGHAHVPCDRWDAEEEGQRQFGALRMPIAHSAFRSRFSVRSRRGFHAARLEAGALNLGLRVVTRSARCQRQRLLVFVDSQALMYAARKGRSSGECFVMGLRGVSAHALAADLKLHYGYTPPPRQAAGNDCMSVLPVRASRVGPRIADGDSWRTSTP